MSNKTYYEILEIPTNASKEEIADAYNKAKIAYSADGTAMYSLLDPEECKRIIEQLDEAFHILFNHETRMKYDEAQGIRTSTQSSVEKEEKPFSLSEGLTSLAEQTREHSNPTPIIPAEPAPLVKEPETSAAERESNNKKASDNINFLVAQKKFGLNFEVDEEFEKLIEQTTEYTGDFLRQVREYRNVSIERLSEMTKISKTYLKAIEDENIDKLPAMAYTRGFIFQFAKCLKLTPDLVATSYIYRLKKLKEQNE